MKRITAFCLTLGVISLAGCGGGGGSTSSTTTGSGRAAVLITDSFREDFGHVWATIYHVELVPQGGGTPIVLFDDATGRQIDLKTLRDASGARYSFLGNASIPAGTYTGVNITIGATMQLFQNGAATGNPIPVADSVPKDTSGHPVVAVTFRNAKTIAADATNLVVDFDLARFILRSGQILPAVAEGDGVGLNDPAQHEQDEYRGTVSGLTGTSPDLTFTLNRGNGMKVTVVTTASTALYGDGGTLQEGSVVEVTATLDPTTQNLVATQLEVRGAGTPGTEAEGQRTPRVCGAVSEINATAGTFTVATTMARGFAVGQTSVKVVTSATTVFRGDAGATQTAADFFTALAATPNVSVEGTYDSASNTLTATSAKVIDTSKNGGWEHAPHGFRDGAGGGPRWGNGAVRPPAGSGDATSGTTEH